MNLTPILSTPVEIQIHLVFAIVSIVLGPVALFRKRRDLTHKISGYIWIVGMTGLSVSGLFISSSFAIIGTFGPIHVLSIVALNSIFFGLYYILKGDVHRHEAIMKSLWFGAIGVTGLLTLLPGRTLNRTLFGSNSELAFSAIAVGGFILAILWIRHRPRRVSEMAID